MCFGRKRKCKFTLNGELIEIVDTFKYLGVLFSKNGRFLKAIKENIQKATKGLFTLRRAFSEKFIPLDCQLDLFAKTLDPILLYGSEVWGYETVNVLDQFQLKITKQLLGVRKSTPAYMVYGEIGIIPISVIIKKRMFMYWHRLITGNRNKLAYQLYNIMLRDTITRNVNYKWLSKIESILNETGNSYMWLNQFSNPFNASRVKQNIQDQAIQEMYSLCGNSNKSEDQVKTK